MTAAEWQEANDRYLARAVEWTRLRLARLAPSAPVMVGEPAPADTNEEGPWWQRRRPAPPAITPLLPQTTLDPVADIQRLEAEMEALERQEPPPALTLLSRRLGLSRFESRVLMLCAAMELDTRVASLCARAQNDPQRPYPTFALALMLFDDPAWEALSPDRPLRYWRLLEVNQPPTQGLTTSALRADERIVNYLKGLNTPDDRLALFVEPLTAAPGELPLPPSQDAVAEQIVHRWERADDTQPLPVVQLVGPDGESKQRIAATAAQALERHVYRMNASALQLPSAELETLTRLWQRENALLPLALYVDAQEYDETGRAHDGSLARFLNRMGGVVFVGMREQALPLTRATFTVETAKPTAAEQQALWEQALEHRLNGFAGELAAQFNLTPEAIAAISRDALSEGADEEELGRSLWRACSALTRPRMDVLAQRIGPKARWEQLLVLPDEQTLLLREIAHQVRQRDRVYRQWGFAERMNRGLGISALFAGDSGTGKTMAAEVLANELDLNLYRIDLSGW